MKTKKKVFTAIWDHIRPEFIGFIRVGWLLIVSSSSAQISMSERLNLDGGTLNLDGETLNLDGGDANSRWGQASPHYTTLHRAILKFQLCM